MSKSICDQFGVFALCNQQSCVAMPQLVEFERNKA